MFGSQALETAIGLALMLFVITVGASSVVEIVSRLLSKRAVDLEKTIGAMLAGTAASDAELSAALDAFRGTTIFDAAKAAAGKTLFRRNWKRPSYLSARSFADAVSEMTSRFDATVVAMPVALQIRVESIAGDVSNELTAVKAGLEAWFDETMERLSGSYKRWTTMFLFVFGLAMAVAANASVFHVADRLWHDPVTRQAVVDSATKVASEGEGAIELESIAETTDTLESLRLPVGWSAADAGQWGSEWWEFWGWGWYQLAHVMGWLVTAALVMLGAPFWFDVLTKLVSLRNSGAKPNPAADDAGSATARMQGTVET